MQNERNDGKGHMNYFGYGKDKDAYNYFRGNPKRGKSGFEDLSWTGMDLEKYKHEREEMERMDAE